MLPAKRQPRTVRSPAGIAARPQAPSPVNHTALAMDRAATKRLVIEQRRTLRGTVSSAERTRRRLLVNQCLAPSRATGGEEPFEARHPAAMLAKPQRSLPEGGIRRAAVRYPADRENPDGAGRFLHSVHQRRSGIRMQELCSRGDATLLRQSQKATAQTLKTGVVRVHLTRDGTRFRPNSDKEARKVPPGKVDWLRFATRASASSRV